jgi:hypothetical protein
VHEIVRDIDPTRTLMQAAGISATQLKRFTQTANAEERHRDGKFDAPSKPMPLSEARTLVSKLLQAWLDRGP